MAMSQNWSITTNFRHPNNVLSNALLKSNFGNGTTAIRLLMLKGTVYNITVYLFGVYAHLRYSRKHFIKLLHRQTKFILWFLNKWSLHKGATNIYTCISSPKRALHLDDVIQNIYTSKVTYLKLLLFTPY